MTYSRTETVRMARELVTNQTPFPIKCGQYRFDQFGQGVWEPEADGESRKLTPAGEWITDLATLGEVELTKGEVANVAFEAGRLIGDDSVAVRARPRVS
jgi:hypothetical protein